MATFSTGYTFGFAAAICVVCSTALAGVSLGLKDMQELNKKRDLQANILGALQLPEDGSSPKGEVIDKLFAERVELLVLDQSGKPVEAGKGDLNGDGAVDQLDINQARSAVKGTERAPELLGVYLRKDGDSVGAVAVPMYGKGLWGPLSGYMALDAKGTEVLGTAFFAPKETPGLGAEIQNSSFKAQWVGKKVVAGGQTKTIRVVKGKASDICPDELEHCVDGVSGATITSVGVDEMVADALRLYDPYLKSLRGGN